MKQFEAERVKRQSRLSRTDIQTLYREGIITEKEFRKAFTNLGYIDKDIDLILKLMGKSKTFPDKLPSLDDVMGWYQNEIINGVRFVRIMRRIGYRDEWIDLYAKSSGRPLNDSIKKEMGLPDEDEWENL